MNTFNVKTKICFGEASLSELGKLSAESAVLFTDAFMAKSGAAGKIAAEMTSCARVSIFSEIIPDPPVELIAKGLSFLLENGADLAVALGGGSSIDAAKSTVLMYEKKTGRSIPLIAVPTTSGTGSEVTQFAVITDREAGVKYPLVSEKLLPATAILVPELVMSVPKSVTADTGFDVMTHALEAYISKNAHDFSDAFAEKAFELCFEYLPKAYADGNDREAREKMHNASCLAGLAFNDVSLGVNHGIAHALGAVFHIPHGKANAMLLYHVLKYNAGFTDGTSNAETGRVRKKLAYASRLVGLSSFSEIQGAQNLLEKIRRMTKELGIPRTLGEAKVEKEAYLAAKAHIVDSAVKDACTATNPRKIEREDVERILKALEVF